MPHHPRLAGLPPFLVEAPPHPVRRRLQNQLCSRGHRRPQPGKGLRRVARPARHLRAVQILHRQSSARVPVCRRYHSVLRVHLRKHDLPHIGPRGHERTLSQLLRQPVNKPVDDPEDLLRSLLRMRDLQGEGARLGDRFHKEPRRRPRGQPHLPGFQHNVPFAAPALKCPLRRIRPQQARLPIAPPHHQQPFRQSHPHRTPPQSGRPLIQDPPEPFQFVPVQPLQAQLPLPRLVRALFLCPCHRSPSSRRTSTGSDTPCSPSTPHWPSALAPSYFHSS